MKPTTYIGIAILAVFCLFVWLAYPVSKEIVYMFGCFAFGWKIDSMANAVYNFYLKRKTA